MSLELAVLKTLLPKLTELRGVSIEMVATGRCEDFSQYRYSAGYIKALDDVMVLCDQILTDIQKG